jgi:hypothetical protein
VDVGNRLDADQPVDLLDAAVARAWPDGVPKSEKVVRARLTGSKAEKLARRLDAVRSWTEAEGDERPASATLAAADAGVSLSQFNTLVAAWRRRRSLASLGVHAGERQSFTRALAPEARDALVAHIRDLLIEHPAARPIEIRRRLEAAGMPSVGDATLLRHVADARRRIPPGAFGGRLILDSAGLDFVDPEGLRMRLYGIVDHGTGLILGWATGTDRSRAVGHVWSARDALDRLPSLSLEGLSACQTGPVLDVRLHVEDQARRLVEDAFGRPPSLGRSSRTLGSTLVETLGERLGDVWLGTGERAAGVEYRTGRHVDLPEYRPEADWIIDPAIERHNASRLALATADVDAAYPAEDAKCHVRDALRCVVRLEGAIGSLPDYAWLSK